VASSKTLTAAEESYGGQPLAVIEMGTNLSFVSSYQQ
jgi:hypothetical protein